MLSTKDNLECTSRTILNKVIVKQEKLITGHGRHVAEPLVKVYVP